MTSMSQSPFQLVPCSPCIRSDLTNKHSPAVPSTPNITNRNLAESPQIDITSRGVPGTPIPPTNRAQQSKDTPYMDSGEQIVPRVATPVNDGFRIPNVFRTPQERSKPSPRPPNSTEQVQGLRRANQRRRIVNLNRNTPNTTREIDLFNGEDIFE
ncbi:uncharacterized protein LOC129265641 isoform X2 [Lytechinus pictus]